MLQACQIVATLSSTLFAGAAIYISLVEHPARMGCSTETAATVWAPSYKRATLMQAPLALVGALGAAASWYLGGGMMWLIGAGIILSVVPFTLLVIAPTNQKLLEPSRDLSSNETRTLLEHWGALHAVRSIVSLAASALFLWLLAQSA